MFIRVLKNYSDNNNISDLSRLSYFSFIWTIC